MSQAAASVVNFSISLILANMFRGEVYGAVALAVSFGLFAVSAQRSSLGDPGIALRAEASPAVGGMRRATLLTGLLVCLSLAAVGLPFMGASAALVALAVLPIYLQDGFRYANVISDRARTALVFDVLWAAPAGIATLGLLSSLLDAQSALAIWAISGVFSLSAQLIMLLRLKAFDSSIVVYLRTVRSLSGWTSMQFLAGSGVMQATLALIPLGVGLAAFGALRAVQVTVSPMNVLVLALSSPILALISARTAARGPSLRRTLATSMAMATGAALPSTWVWLNREWFVATIVGESYVSNANLVGPALVSITLVAATLPLSGALLALRRGRLLFIASTVVTGVTSAMIVFIAFTGTLEQLAWGQAFQYLAIFFTMLGCVSASERRNQPRTVQ